MFSAETWRFVRVSRATRTTACQCHETHLGRCGWNLTRTAAGKTCLALVCSLGFGACASGGSSQQARLELDPGTYATLHARYLPDAKQICTTQFKEAANDPTSVTIVTDWAPLPEDDEEKIRSLASRNTFIYFAQIRGRNVRGTTELHAVGCYVELKEDKVEFVKFIEG